LLSIVLSHRLLPRSKPEAFLLLSATALAIAAYNGHLERRGYFTRFDDRFEKLGAGARAVQTAVVVVSMVSCFGAMLYLADRASKLPW
jgi:hypothetical protein